MSLYDTWFEYFFDPSFKTDKQGHPNRENNTKGKSKPKRRLKKPRPCSSVVRNAQRKIKNVSRVDNYNTIQNEPLENGYIDRLYNTKTYRIDSKSRTRERESSKLSFQDNNSISKSRISKYECQLI